MEWRATDEIEIALYRFEYRQDEISDEIRETSVDIDPDGVNRDLGRETDLIVTLTPREGLEIILLVAEFDPGKAYGALSGERTSFINLELAYEF